MYPQAPKNLLIENANDRLQNSVDRIANAAGFKIDINTLTEIKAQVTTQKFYEVAPSGFMPVVVGEGAWADELLTYRTGSVSDPFESGLLAQGSSGAARDSMAETQIEGVKVPVKYWKRAFAYNLVELNQATRSGNWSLVEAKEEARFKSWQLGIQKVAFLGLQDTGVSGLLTQSDVTSNTSLITKTISSMNASEFQALLAGLFTSYNTNCNSTVMPDTFVIPTSDYLGLVSSVDETYPLKSRLERLVESGKLATMNQGFQVLPLAYSEAAKNADFLGSGSGLNRYIMYVRNDRQSLRMDVPVDYTQTITDTVSGFDYSSVAYGGFTGAKAYRPLEMLYFDY